MSIFCAFFFFVGKIFFPFDTKMMHQRNQFEMEREMEQDLQLQNQERMRSEQMRNDRLSGMTSLGMPPPSLAGPGSLIKDRWKLLRKIGHGAFGEIYSARNLVTGELVAIKFEKVGEREVLKLEVAVVKKLQTCPYVVRFISCGRHRDYNFMVMELLGENISELRRAQPNGRFSMLTTLKLSLLMLRAIERVHELGFLHRDIKPSNYAMGLSPTKRNLCYLIDFGLARRYVLPTGAVRPARESAGFRGTARYASINSHQSKDLGRRDDLWSLLYVMIEFSKGQLPWRRVRDKDAVGEMKKKYLGPNLVADLPNEFLLFMQHLQSLKYADKPDYHYMTAILTHLYHKLGGDENTPFDWERVPYRHAARQRPLPSLLDLCFLKLASNIEDFPDMMIPYSVKKRMLDFLIRIHDGKLPRPLLDRLLDRNLQEVDLSPCQFTEADYHYVAQTCTRLRSLTLGATSDQILKDILTNNPNLEQLSFRPTRALTAKGIKLIAERCERLTSLKIARSDKISDKPIEYILRHCTKLRELSLVGCKRFKGTAFKTFSNSKKRQLRLQKLDLSYCELSKRGFKQLLKVCSSLQTLKFAPLVTAFKISSVDFHNLIQSCKNLLVLELANYIIEMDAILIEVSRSCTQLTHLILDGIGMTDYGLQNVVQNCSRLQTIRFRYGDGVSDASLHQIAKSCPNVKSLSIAFWSKYNQLSVSDQAIKNLLQCCTSLTELSLSNCLTLTAACFPEVGFFPLLQTLNLSDCVQLNDFAIRRITESCPNLRKLFLNNVNNLTSSSLEAIALGCPLLEDLFLTSCCCFKDETLKNLLRSMPKLFIHVTRYPQRELSGVETEVHSTTVDQIFTQYPNTYRDLILSKKSELSSRAVPLYNY
jgi:serine/threonine protein kinase